MEIKDAYKQKMTAQLKEWGAQIDLLEAKLENTGADMKVRHAEELHELRAKQRVASEKMQELEKATGEAWEQVRETTDKIWEDIKTGLADTHSRFR